MNAGLKWTIIFLIAVILIDEWAYAVWKGANRGEHYSHLWTKAARRAPKESGTVTGELNYPRGSKGKRL